MLVGDRKRVITWLMDQPEDKQWEIREHKEKRSLDSNRYYWLLLGELKTALRTSTEELHELLLKRYSVPAEDGDGKPIVVTMKSSIPISRLPGHWMQVGGKGGFSSYMMIKGSSDMNTKEMSALLDGLISECKEVGIETMTPDEVARLKGYEKQANQSL